MATPIKLKHSSQAGKVPTAGDLTAGEVAVNTADVKAYIKDAAGNVVQLAGKDNPVNDDRYVQKDGDTMDGQLTLPGGGTGSQAITVDEVDTAITTAVDAIDDYVEKAGDTMTGQLTLPGGGTGSEAITVDEVDTAIAAIDDYVEKDGDNMTGNLTLGTDKITLDATEGEILVKSGGDTTARIYNEGTVKLGKGDTTAGFMYSVGGTIGNGFAKLYGNSSTDETQSALIIDKDKDASDPAVSISYDGSAEFAGGIIDIGADGRVNTSSFISANGDPGDNTKTTTQLTGEGLHLRRTNDNKQVGIFDKYGLRMSDDEFATNKFLLSPDGTAEFKGEVKLNDGFDSSVPIPNGYGSCRYRDNVLSVGQNNGASTANPPTLNFGTVVNAGNHTVNFKLNKNADYFNNNWQFIIDYKGPNTDRELLKFSQDGSADFAGGAFTIDSIGSVECNRVKTHALTVDNDPIRHTNYKTESGAEAVIGTIFKNAYAGNQGTRKDTCLLISNTNAIDGATVKINYNGKAEFAGDVKSGGKVLTRNVTLNLDPDNDANYTSTIEKYTETETYEVEVPVPQTGAGTADIKDRETKTITRTREVEKEREVKTYTGPTMDVKEELLYLRERATYQDDIISQMTAALKKLGADIDVPTTADKKRSKKK